MKIDEMNEEEKREAIEGHIEELAPWRRTLLDAFFNGELGRQGFKNVVLKKFPESAEQLREEGPDFEAVLPWEYVKRIADHCDIDLPEHENPQAWVGFSEPSCISEFTLAPLCLARLFPALSSEKKNHLLENRIENYLGYMRKKLGDEGAEEVENQNSDEKILEDIRLTEAEEAKNFPNDREVYAECDWCGEPIYFGNAVVSVNKNIEQVSDSPEGENSVITVIRSDGLLNLCAACGNRLDEDKLNEFLQAGLPNAI